MSFDDMFWGDAPPPPDPSDGDAVNAGRRGVKDADSEEEPDDAHLDYYNPQTHEAGEAAEEEDQVVFQDATHVGAIPSATGKRITTDYNSDDNRIIQLKEQGRNEEAIADILLKEGRMSYKPKSIAGRIGRIMKMMRKTENDLLDDEMTDWHEGEDDPLKTVQAKLAKKLEDQYEKLKEKMWEDVSHQFAISLGVKRKYSGKACRERFEALEAGTALLPIELDPDKVGRRKLRNERIARAKKLRKDARESQRSQEAAKVADSKARKLREEEARAKREKVAAQRKVDKAGLKRVKQERRLAQINRRKRRDAVMKYMQDARRWERTRHRKEDELCKKFTGMTCSAWRTLLDKADARSKSGLFNDGLLNDFSDDEEELDWQDDIDDEDTNDEYNEADAEEADTTTRRAISTQATRRRSTRNFSKPGKNYVDELGQADDEDEAEDSLFVPLSQTPLKRRASFEELRGPLAKRNGKNQQSMDKEANVTISDNYELGEDVPSLIRPSKDYIPPRKPTAKGKAKATTSAILGDSPEKNLSLNNGGLQITAPVTAESLMNPRSILNYFELTEILIIREFPVLENESHAQRVARLAALDDSCRKKDIEDLLRETPQKLKGTKPELIRRLQIADAESSTAGYMGVHSTDLDFVRQYEGYTGEFAGLPAKYAQALQRNPVDGGNRIDDLDSLFVA